MAYNNNQSTTGSTGAPLGNPLTSNAAFVPSELSNQQSGGQHGGLSHQDQYQTSQNPVSSHEHHTPSHPSSGGGGMTNNFSAVPSSNTAAMTSGFAPVPTGHHNTTQQQGQNYDGQQSHHQTHDKREDGGVVDALNPAKGSGMHLPHSGSGNQHQSHDQHQGQHQSGQGHLAQGAGIAAVGSHNQHNQHDPSRHTDGSPAFATNPTGPHGDQSVLSGHHSRHDPTHDSSVAGSRGAQGLSLEQSRASANQGGPTYPDPSTTSSHHSSSTHGGPGAYPNPTGHGTTNVHGSHGTTGTYGHDSAQGHLPGQGAHTGQTLPGHNEHNPLHKGGAGSLEHGTRNNEPHSTTAGHGIHNTTGATGGAAPYNTFVTPGHEPTGTGVGATGVGGHHSATTSTAAAAGHDAPGAGLDHGAHSTTGSHTTGSHSTTGAGHGATGHDAAHKPTMGEKLKGTMEVLSGKMSGNPEKVAEGQALKSGQPVTGAGAGVGGVGSHTGSGTGIGGNHTGSAGPGFGHTETGSTGTGVTGGTPSGGAGLGHGQHTTGAGTAHQSGTTGSGL